MRPGFSFPRNEGGREREAMGETEITFRIPQKIDRVLRWFMEALPQLISEDEDESEAELILEPPTLERPDKPDVNTDKANIIFTANKVEKWVRVRSDWLPSPPFFDLKPQTTPLGRAMLFRFHALRGETYVWASCAERHLSVQKVFEDFLKQIEKHYPVVGPLCSEYVTKLTERMKEEMKAEFGGTEAAQDAQARTDPPAPPQRRRGRKRTDPKEINKICADWLKVQHRVSQIDFCNGKGISTSRLRSWLKDYPHPES
jgi:hypothetical protein